METKEIIQEKDIEVSVIVPVVERYDDLEKLYLYHAAAIAKVTRDFEFIFIVDGHMHRAYSEIKKFSAQNPHIKLIKLPKTFGESNALSLGFEMAKGRYIFTLSSYFQVEPEEFGKLYNLLVKDGYDLAVARRHRAKDSMINKTQSFIFHFFLRIVTGSRFKDVSCGFKGMKREAINQIEIYGDLHRFIPIIAESQGLTVKEIVVSQRREDTRFRIYKVRTYLTRVIDILTIFFLLRFVFKPLRFFGVIGSFLLAGGVTINSYLIYHRLFSYNFSLTNKPSLFLSALLIVAGIQFFAIGIIGEIIIYTHGKKAKKFNIKNILE